MELQVGQIAQKVKEHLKNEREVKVEFDKEGFVDRIVERLRDDDEFRQNIASFCAGMAQTMLDTAYGDFPNTASMAQTFLAADLANYCCCISKEEKACTED